MANLQPVLANPSVIKIPAVHRISVCNCIASYKFINSSVKGDFGNAYALSPTLPSAAESSQILLQCVTTLTNAGLRYIVGKSSISQRQSSHQNKHISNSARVRGIPGLIDGALTLELFPTCQISMKIVLRVILNCLSHCASFN